MRRTVVAALASAILAAACLLGASGPAVAATDQPQWAVAMLRLVNVQRAKVGADPLVLCEPLMVAAGKYARVMARTGHFDHTGPDGSQPWDRGSAEGYQYRAFGENIAAGQRTVRQVMVAWVHSPGHYANLVSTSFTHLGVGHATSRGSRFSEYWVQDFGAGGRC